MGELKKYQTGKVIKELEFRTSRSGGKGGQHTNKAETRVELLFDVRNSQVLSSEQKRKLLQLGKNRINKEGVLSMASEDSRSQEQNKEKVIERFLTFLRKTLKERKRRKKTKPPKRAKEERIKKKKERGEKKKWRKPPDGS